MYTSVGRGQRNVGRLRGTRRVYGRKEEPRYSLFLLRNLLNRKRRMEINARRRTHEIITDRRSNSLQTHTITLGKITLSFDILKTLNIEDPNAYKNKLADRYLYTKG